MIFLVNCTYEQSYLGEDFKKVEMNNIVEAENEIEAMQKVVRFYRTKDYDISLVFPVSINYCNKLIS